MKLNEAAKIVHTANARWWKDLETGLPLKRNAGNLLMLVITEFSEAVEGIRKNLMDDKIPYRLMEEVEMADAKIRLLDIAAGFNLVLWEETISIPDLEFTGDKGEEILKICHLITTCYFSEGPLSRAQLITMAIRWIESYCKHYNLDIEGAFNDKMAFNAIREDHKYEARKLKHGKKF